MQIKTVDNNAFGCKNTFLLKSWHALSNIEMDYYRSLHHEAKSRINFIKFNKSYRNVTKHSELETLEDNYEVTLGLAKMFYYKLMSVVHEIISHKVFPNRFAEPDNIHARVRRNYKIKENYKHLIKD